MVHRTPRRRAYHHSHTTRGGSERHSKILEPQEKREGEDFNFITKDTWSKFDLSRSMTTPVTAGSSRADINSKRPPDMIHFRGREVDQHEVNSLPSILDLEQGHQTISLIREYARIIIDIMRINYTCRWIRIVRKYNIKWMIKDSELEEKQSNCITKN